MERPKLGGAIISQHWAENASESPQSEFVKVTGKRKVSQSLTRTPNLTFKRNINHNDRVTSAQSKRA